MTVTWLPIFVVLAIAAVWDIAKRRIPNWLVVPFLAAGLVLNGFRGGLAGLGVSLAGIAAAALLIGPFCWLGGMGMGDLKLCAAVGAWIGPGQICFALVMTGIAGGTLAVCYAFWHRSLGRSLSGTGELISGLFHGTSQRNGDLSLANPAALSIPYAPAIAIGTVFAFLASHS